ncbi:hypothetical protein MUO79_05090 [Candidatus Bathyarchaeota archaeon]|nr:hypothetical protein [Candidatus Bathyarchaeota archaeon]
MMQNEKTNQASQEGSQTKCEGCKRGVEHYSAVLPFAVIEKLVDKPLRIRGVAMTAGMSRNFNIYTPQELEAFSSKLVNSPVYIEHVSVDSAVGKVTKTDWDGHALWYEAEIYESDVADKIRKGLVQHVSVGADYEAVDLVDGKVPHGLHNAELSLVAVPGIPETNISVLEALSHGSERKVVKAGSCVFCGKAANYLVSSCKSCFDKFPADVHASQDVPSGIESMKEEDLQKLVTEAVEKGNVELKATREKLAETEGKLGTAEKALTEANGKLVDTGSKLAEAQKTIEQLKKTQPSNGLVKEQPKTLPISEAITVLEGLLPCPAVERSTMGMQRECQEIRAAIHKLKVRSA